jgi:hypothetical protein
VIRATPSEVEIDFGDEVEVVPRKDWRVRLFNRTIHVQGLPGGWRGMYILRDMPAHNATATARTGDFFFQITGYNAERVRKIRSCKEARQTLMEMHPGDDNLLRLIECLTTLCPEPYSLCPKLHTLYPIPYTLYPKPYA